MGEVTVEIPAERFESFRLAVLHEIGDDAEWVAGMQDELSRRMASDRYVLDDEELVDIDGAARHLGQALAVAHQLFPRPAANGSSIKVSGDVQTLAHVAEAMANKVVSQQIADETDTSPLDAEAASTVDELVNALGWATGEAARLHALVSVERKRDREGS